jgi:hypothetical protein
MLLLSLEWLWEMKGQVEERDGKKQVHTGTSSTYIRYVVDDSTSGIIAILIIITC